MVRTLHALRRAGSLTVLILFPAVGLAQAASADKRPASVSVEAAADPLPVDPALTIGTLPNGLRYYVRAHPTPAGRAELRLVVNAGSVLEDDDQRGLAHFLEHMAFNGTRRFPKRALVDYLQSVGMRFGGDLNAQTGYEETVYRLTIPTDDLTLVERGIEILEDWATGIVLDSAEVAAERGVVLEEWRSRLGRAARIGARNDSVIYAGSRYVDRSPIGLPETIARAGVAEVARFYRDWYRPDLMAVVAVGDFDAAKIEALIRRHFAGIPKPAAPRPRPIVELPALATTSVAVFTDSTASAAGISLIARRPLTDRGRVATLRQHLVDVLGVRVLGSRLRELSRGTNPPFLRAEVAAGNLQRVARFTRLGVTAPAEEVETALAAAFAEVERMAQHGATAAELDREKKSLLTRLRSDSVKASVRPSAALARNYVEHYLEGGPAMSADQTLALARQLLAEIAPADLAQFARGFRSDSNRVLLVTVPAGAGTPPAREALLAALDSVARLKLEPYVAEVSDGLLLAEPPEFGVVVEERRHEAVDVTEWTLSNGARVFLKPTDFNPDHLLIRGVSPGGLSLASDADYVSARFATEMLAVGGLGQYDQSELAQLVAGRAIGRVGITIGERAEAIYAEGSPSEAELLLQLLYLQFTAPRADTAAVAVWRANAKARLGQNLTTPAAIVAQLLGNGHPRVRVVTPAMVDSADVDRALAFVRERFRDAADFAFLIVGAFEPEQIRPLVERYLGGLPSHGGRETPRDVGIRTPAGAVRVRASILAEPKAEVYLTFSGPFEHSRENAYLLNSLGSMLQLRLTARLREELGGTYGVVVQPSLVWQDTSRYRVTVTFGSAPERAEELTKAVFDVIETLQADGPTAAELAEVLEMQRRSAETGLRQNHYWAHILESHIQAGWPLDEGILSPTRYHRGQLTVEAIRDAARRYLRRNEYVQITFLPRASEPPATRPQADGPQAKRAAEAPAVEGAP